MLLVWPSQDGECEAELENAYTTEPPHPHSCTYARYRTTLVYTYSVAACYVQVIYLLYTKCKTKTTKFVSHRRRGRNIWPEIRDEKDDLTAPREPGAMRDFGSVLRKISFPTRTKECLCVGLCLSQLVYAFIFVVYVQRV